jgi:hypothetical protein
VIGSNNSHLPKILNILVKVYKRDSCSDETSTGIAKLLGSIPEATLLQMMAGFSDIDKKKAVRIVQEYRSTQ